MLESVRLYLSSFRMGSCRQQLLRLTRDGRRAAVIANAADAYPADERSEAVDREVGALRSLGFVAEELDLRKHFEDSSVDHVLRNYDLVWVRGGDVHTLRYTFARSGADDALVGLLADDALVYGGYARGYAYLARAFVDWN